MSSARAVRCRLKCHNEQPLSLVAIRSSWALWGHCHRKVLSLIHILVLTDTYGDIPFTGALDVENNPHAAFDDSKTVVYPGILEIDVYKRHSPILSQ